MGEQACTARQRHKGAQLGKSTMLFMLHGANAASCTLRDENCSQIVVECLVPKGSPFSKVWHLDNGLYSLGGFRKVPVC